MARPRKADLGPVPTRERLLLQAIELFAAKGYDAVSVRDIVRPLGLTEATLYVHFKNKADLLEAIFQRFESTLLETRFIVPDPSAFRDLERFDLAENLIQGARAFYDQADETTRLIWRVLLTHQYRHPAARRSVETYLLRETQQFFSGLLQSMKSAECLPGSLDHESAGRTLTALFFQYSFHANLLIAWNADTQSITADLERDLSQLAALLTAG